MVLHDAFKMMITRLFYFDSSGKNFFHKKNLRSKNFKQNLRHQLEKAEAELEALRLKVKTTQVASTSLIKDHASFCVDKKSYYGKFKC